MRRGTNVLSFLVCLMLIMSVFAACGENTSEKEYTKNGLTITLPENAKEMDDSYGYSAAYQIGNTIVIAAMEESLDMLSSLGLDETSTVEDYAKLVAEVNGYSADDVTTITGTDIPMFEYSSTVSDVEYKYIGSCYKGTDSFWFINFGTVASNYDSVKEDFERWAASVKI